MSDKKAEQSGVGDSESRIHEQGPDQGRISAAPPPGSTESHDRPTFNDPVPGNIDPTAPASPENTVPFQKDRTLQGSGATDLSPQQNLEPWRIVDPATGESEKRG
jgi:hypothetical protein